MTAESGGNMIGNRASDPLGNRFRSRSDSENVDVISVDDQDTHQRPHKKRYHRHAQHKIQEMEA